MLHWPGATLAAREPGQPLPTITDPAQVWALPTELKSSAIPLRIEGRVSYSDPLFRMFWIERNNIGTYLQLDASPPPFRDGQYVVIEGTITPNKGLSAQDVQVRVVEENAPITPLDTQGRINDLAEFHARIVTAKGYVDSQQSNDDEHVRLILIVENRPVICWVRPDNPKSVPDWRGSFVQVTGLYSRKFDPTQTNTTIEIWLGRQDGLRVLGNLQNSAQFDRPVTTINGLYLQPPGTEVRVRGRIVSHQAGTAMIVRDETGQVEIRSIQQQRIPLGAEVEAAGQVNIFSGQWVINPALYRPVQPVAAAPNVAPSAALTTVAQIRSLSPGEEAQQQPVDLRGVVVWSLPEANSNFFYLQDVTGGIRVYIDRNKIGAFRYGKYLQVKGVTHAGRFAPTVEMRDFIDLGSLSEPAARPSTLEQALTGKEEGQWVELRGFVRDTVSKGDWRWIHVTTPAGEFTGRLQNPVNFVANPGSLIRAHGICETAADEADGQSNGVTLWIPFLHDITIEEDAPADFYNLPLRSIRELDQLSTGQNMTRVRLTGVVLHSVTGSSVYVQEGAAALLVLSHETVPVAPGDRIEAVGILGREGARTILREAIYRKTGTSPPPVPMTMENPALLSLANDSRLVRVRGTLIDEFDQPGRTRLTMQAGKTVFESVWERAPGMASPDFTPGTGLELTGIYRLEFDDSHQMRGFQLQLRTPGDIVVFQKPRLWTIRRALIAAAIFGTCTLLGLAWITALHRQVRRQTGQIRAQLEHQARLEIEVQRAARLESLGELAGGIAHDFNNVLTGIMGYTSLAMLDRTAMTSVGNYLREIDRGGRRARDLTQQLLTFAKGGDPLRETVSLPGLIREATELVLHDSKVSCEFDEPPGLWSVNADRGQISQVIQNLMRNALQAMPHGGVIRVLLANDQLAAGVKAGLAAGHYVRLFMTDTGEGISAENLPRIFEPYFSTRNAGGMGLATVYSIVKKHQGLVEVQSVPGHGTTFRMWLPAAEPAAPPSPAVPPKAKAPATPLRVLLMDDEESIRHLAELVLQQMGLEVTTVADGNNAMREFDQARNAGRPYGLAILDLTIAGGMGGRETIEQLRKKDPDLLAIVSSGYSSDPVMANFRDYGFQAIVPKPYNIEQFTQTVGRLLKQHRDRSLHS
jgi:two-component system cell cycle sensor histidine kinase/response regulator CckA